VATRDKKDLVQLFAPAKEGAAGPAVTTRFDAATLQDLVVSDRRQPVCRQQHDPRPPNHLLRRVPVPDQLLQSGAKAGFITGQNILIDGGAYPGTL
jgi:hypothetical protein